MLIKRKNKGKEEGSAAIEFAILLPLLLILFFGSFELSRYILVNRKIDNVANDVSLFLSREGVIYDVNGDGVINGASEDEKRLERLVRSISDMLLYPYAQDEFASIVTFVGRPVNAAIDRDDARVMWQHYMGGVSNTGKGDIANFPELEASAKFTVSTSGGGTKVNTYTDSFGERAELLYEGDGFILFNSAYKYNSVITNIKQYVTLDFTNASILKAGSYKVRSRWIDSGPGGIPDGVIGANEYYNEMHLCVECNMLDSDRLTSSTGRKKCNAASYPAESSGCSFN
ncbi:MAG: hypothetical protein COV36_07840 [Alphaproteobacteria bacterium CG11_big_fil_rev_8_21_14_0_20_44_7]|nr:MAG: hypothetical protein COV36_07840 [Alphaproteobacteria bacterium CG11_big_fil_rev_8_21_14_0_20_44_7]